MGRALQIPNNTKYHICDSDLNLLIAQCELNSAKLKTGRLSDPFSPVIEITAVLLLSRPRCLR